MTSSSEEAVVAINNNDATNKEDIPKIKPTLQPLLPSPSSRLSKLYTKHHAILQRLDDIESRISSRISAYRRRATNNLDDIPTVRRSHMRLFISHRVQEGGDKDEEEEEKKKEEDEQQQQATAAAAAANAPSPPRPMVGHGGKDFSALLHSSAHQKAEEEAKQKQKQAPLRGQPSNKGVRKWTLVIEGGLLIKHLDHISAKAVDDRLNSGLPILGCMNTNSDGGSSNDVKAKEAAQQAKQQQQQKDASDANLPIRDQWRGQSENELEIDPIQFTHLFDKVEVELKIIKQNNDKATDQLETSAITRSGLGAVPDPPSPEEIAEVKKIVWERSKSQTPDTNAFFIVHNELSEFKSMGGKVFKSIFKTDHIVAKIKLYRRQSEDDSMANYIPSTQLCNVFFPTFIGKRAAGDGKGKSDNKGSKSSKKRKRGGGGDSTNMSRTNSSANFMDTNEASNSSIGSNNIPPGKEAAFAQQRQQPVGSFEDDDDIHKDVHVPNTITMDEALHAIFFYVRTRELQDPTDLSIINNDETLTNLFGCTQMSFASVRGLLLELQLLVRVQPCTQPIIFVYDMTLDGAEPLTKKKKKSRAKKEEEEEEKDVPSPSGGAGSSTRRRSTNAAYKSDDEKSDTEQDEPHQTMLSMDIDVEVPNLYHVRVRNLLRRITLQSFEYTSPRIKCIRSLMATGVDEETAKQVLVDVVSGKGYAPYHKQALMAIGNGAQQGGEVQRAAMIDLRTAALLEKLEEQTSLARSYWDVVHACQGLCAADEK